MSFIRTNGLVLPVYTTAGRNALTIVPGTNPVIFNSNTNTLQFYNGTVWVEVGAGGGGGGITSVNADTGPVVVLDPDDLNDAATTNKFTSAGDISKLAGIETGATADQTNVEIEAGYSAQVGIVSQAEAEAGVATTVRRWTAERVRQSVSSFGGGSIQSETGSFTTSLLPQGNTDVEVVAHSLGTDNVTIDVFVFSAAAGFALHNVSTRRADGSLSFRHQANTTLIPSPGTTPPSGSVNISIQNTDATAKTFDVFYKITSGVFGSPGHVIEDEGTPLTQRNTIDFQGAGVTATDDGAQTIVTIPGGGGGGGGGALQTTRISRTTSAALTPGVPTDVSWEVEDVDQDNQFLIVNPTQIVIATTGEYLVGMTLFMGGTSFDWQWFLNVNGVSIDEETFVNSSPTTKDTRWTLNRRSTVQFGLTSGDVITLRILPVVPTLILEPKSKMWVTRLS